MPAIRGLTDPKCPEPAYSLVAIWRDLPGFTRDGSACGSDRARPKECETSNRDTEGQTMTTLEATKSKTSSGVTRSGRLFVLELNAGLIHTMNPDGSDKKTIVTNGRLPDGI